MKHTKIIFIIEGIIMTGLFLRTDKGDLPIELRIIEKYGLRKGMFSPFNRYLIVDENGNGEDEALKRNEHFEISKKDKNTRIFSSAEAIDITKGTDSY